MARLIGLDVMTRMLATAPDGDVCLEWPLSDNGHGYGRMTYKGKRRLAHCVAYELTNGPIPEGHGVLHRCDNPKCFRPDHLFTGTQAVNMQDCADKGRWNGPIGERQWCARLKQADVIEIRRLAAEGVTLRGIARQFSAGRTTVGKIVHRQIWKSVA